MKSHFSCFFFLKPPRASDASAGAEAPLRLSGAALRGPRVPEPAAGAGPYAHGLLHRFVSPGGAHGSDGGM